MVKVRAEPAGAGWRCLVTIEQAGELTEHTVSVSAADLGRWGRGVTRTDVEDLVTRSFAFLLEREPPGSILRSFDLSVIPRYYPEFDSAFGSETA